MVPALRRRWGSPTYIHGRFYVQLANNGTQAHRRIAALNQDADTATFDHDLDWITQSGALFFTERRMLRAHLISPDAWALDVRDADDERLRNGRRHGIADHQGTGERRIRRPVLAGPTVVHRRSVRDRGRPGREEVRGRRMQSMAFAGRHDETDAESLVLIVDDAANRNHPPQWFARTEEFACLNAAPFFSEVLTIEQGSTVRFRYGVGIADADASAAPALAEAVREVLARSDAPVAAGERPALRLDPSSRTGAALAAEQRAGGGRL
ncbi:DUF6807 family protein [Streptomyces iakyrus]|uniref:DUF6807 family protein n=1 Tax=Streptomyces iakyrus TaxID=68219 RepID=UPI0033FB9FAF